jgi:hypothetical protein
MNESSYHYRYYSDRIFDLEVKKERLKFELKELEQELTSSKERRDFWRNKMNKEPLTK